MSATRTDAPVPIGDSRARRGRGGLHTGLVTVLACVAFVVVNALVGDHGLASLLRARQNPARLARDVEARQAENDRLREQIRRLRGGDVTAIEEIARRDLGLIRPGERLFIIRDAPAPGHQ